MLKQCAKWAVVLALMCSLVGCDQTPGVRILTLGIEYPGIEPYDFLIDGEPPKRNLGKAPHTWEWPGLGPGVYEITYTLHGVPMRTVVETHIAGAMLFIEFAGMVQPDTEFGEYTILEETTPVGDTGYAPGGETVKVWVNNGYFGGNRVTNITLGGWKANRAELGPPQMLYWNSIPVGKHRLAFEYDGKLFGTDVQIHQQGAMFGVVEGGVVEVDARFGEMPGRR